MNGFLINKTLKDYIDKRVEELVKKILTNRGLIEDVTEDVDIITGDEETDGSIRNMRRRILGNVGEEFDTIEEVVGNIKEFKSDVNSGFKEVSNRDTTITLSLDHKSEAILHGIHKEAILDIYFIAPDGRDIDVMHWEYENDILTAFNVFQGDLANQSLKITYLRDTNVVIK